MKINESLRSQSLNTGWLFSKGLRDVYTGKTGDMEVNLPHDYMVSCNTAADAPSGTAGAFYPGHIANYAAWLTFPESWKDDCISLVFDGVMMNTAVEVNGGLIALQHNGYTSFEADLTNRIYWDGENRLTVAVNPSMQPASRWYTGAGIYRSVTLVHKPKLHIVNDGIYVHTERLAGISADGRTAAEAYMIAEVTVMNRLAEDRVAMVSMTLTPENDPVKAVTRQARVFIKAGQYETVRIPITVRDAYLWNAEHPALYTAEASVTELGVFDITLHPTETPLADKVAVTTGIRTLTADAIHGLMVNGESVKLRGGCVHHDNGVIGAVSMRDAEERRVRRLKECGFNAIRTAHNPASTALLEACDRMGLYVFTEAFDAWGMHKQPGDYNQFFQSDWEKDIHAFICRDRNHPSILIWSTGNEIPERGGLNNGYQLAKRIADAIRTLDSTRLISNGMCSYWCALDDRSMSSLLNAFAEQGGQNANFNIGTLWEERSEPFLNGLDVIGYNYLDGLYADDHKLYPERIICGTESFPWLTETVWARTEEHDFVIGDFVWTAMDHLGEAAIGQSLFIDRDKIPNGFTGHSLSSQKAGYPWRLCNCGALDLCSGVNPSGAYRKVIWGDCGTHLYVQNPAHFHQAEFLSDWGWPELYASWRWPGSEGKNTKVVVYSAAEEVALYLNGELSAIASAGKAHHFTAEFVLPYAPGVLRAISLHDGQPISEAVLTTPGKPAAIRLLPETSTMVKGCDSLCYVNVELVDADGNLVTDAECELTAAVSGTAHLLGFGSSNPKTTDNYAAGRCHAYGGRALAVLRSGEDAGEAVLTVSCADGVQTTNVILPVQESY